MKKINIGAAALEMTRGDISLETTDAIVNAANNYLWMGSGVAGALKAKGGEEIELEATSKGPIEVGQALLTTAGKLKARYVIHAAAMGQDLSTDAAKIKMATRSALALAESNSLRSISLPALGTGVGGFSVEACAEIMLNETVTFLQSAENVRLVRFVIFSETDLGTFEKALEKIFSA